MLIMAKNLHYLLYERDCHAATPLAMTEEMKELSQWRERECALAMTEKRIRTCHTGKSKLFTLYGRNTGITCNSHG